LLWGLDSIGAVSSFVPFFLIAHSYRLCSSDLKQSILCSPFYVNLKHCLPLKIHHFSRDKKFIYEPLNYPAVWQSNVSFSSLKEVFRFVPITAAGMQSYWVGGGKWP